MSAIINIASLTGLRPFTPANPRTAAPETASPARDVDTADFSPEARALSRAVEDSSLSIARTRAVRAEIEAGTYETSQKISKTVDALLRDLR